MAVTVVVRVMSTPVSTSEQPSSRTAATSRQGALDAAAFDALFRECAGDVHGYLISLLGDRSAAEDLTALVHRLGGGTTIGPLLMRSSMWSVAKRCSMRWHRCRFASVSSCC